MGEGPFPRGRDDPESAAVMNPPPSDPDPDIPKCPSCGGPDFTKAGETTGVLGVDLTVHLFREPSAQSAMDRFVSALMGSRTEDIPSDLAEQQLLIARTFLDLADMVLTKNRKYGGAALNPRRVFSKLDADATIRVRLDDKLTRIANAQDDEDEDPYSDLVGYLVLLLIERRRQWLTKPRP